MRLEQMTAKQFADHPDLNLLAAFVEHRLTKNEREAVVTHLGECADCRQQIALAIKLSRSESEWGARTKRSHWQALRAFFQIDEQWKRASFALACSGLAAVSIFFILHPRPSLQRRVDALRSRGKPDEALQSADALALLNEGRIEASKGHYEAAEHILRQVAESRDRDVSFALLAYGELAGLYARIGKLEAVIPQFEAALTLADETRQRLREDDNKIRYLASLIDVHRKYVDFLMGRGDDAGAFAVAESSRARLLRERLELPRAKVLSQSYAIYEAAAQASGATFLAYWIGPERSYLWAISGKAFATYTLPPEPEIRRLVEHYQGAIERGGSARTEDAAAGTKLFGLLVPPAVRKREGPYLIVPDGPLYGLNFETLPVPGDQPHYWIEDATVAVAPSLDLLLARHAARRHGGPLLLVGDANEWNPEFPKLLYARKEIEGIESGYADGPRTVLAGASATPAAYQKSQPAQFAYIHFATHASANENAPFDSSIILSKDSGGGKLSVKDVLDARLNAELVTVSAFHSAGARTNWGEGLVGFAWAFLQSGAHGVIAGLWDVSDYASPRLMHDLYAGLAASKTPAEALRQAKLQLIASGKYASPYYWGALQLYKGAL
jgi:CHAT domain-containing protein